MKTLQTTIQGNNRDVEARITRVGEYIEITVVKTVTGRWGCRERIEKSLVGVDDPKDQMVHAKILQVTLDGHIGTNSDVTDYLRAIEQFAD